MYPGRYVRDTCSDTDPFVEHEAGRKKEAEEVFPTHEQAEKTWR